MTTTLIFVYGTLRPGEGNDRLWDGRDTPEPLADVVGEDGDWRLDDYRLTGTSFPYAIPAPGAVTVGTLIWSRPGQDEALLERLDRLEGVPHHYKRVPVNVYQQGGGKITAWLYTPADPTWFADCPPVKGNDWKLHQDGMCDECEGNGIAWELQDDGSRMLVPCPSCADKVPVTA